MTLPTEQQKVSLSYLNCFPESEPSYINLNTPQKAETQLKILGKLKYHENLYFNNKSNLS